MHRPASFTIPAGHRPPPRPTRRERPAPDAEHLGVISRAQSAERGVTDARLRALVRTGTLRRIGTGWYASDRADPRAVAAISRGARLTCQDALALQGVWTPPRTRADGLHVYRPRGLLMPGGAIAHGRGLRTWPEPFAVASVPLALDHALQCLDGEAAAIVLESSLRRGQMSPGSVEVLLGAAPVRVRRAIGPLSTASDSGSETRVVRWLRRRGFTVHQQVYVLGVGFVDAVVAGIVLEIDGRTHHSEPDAFEEDRRRDLTLRRWGLQVLRLSYRQVWDTWPDTQQALLATISRCGRLGLRRIAELAGDCC